MVCGVLILCPTLLIGEAAILSAVVCRVCSDCSPVLADGGNVCSAAVAAAEQSDNILSSFSL